MRDHRCCWLTNFLPARKVILKFCWLEEPVKDWGRCSKYSLRICAFVWVLTFLTGLVMSGSVFEVSLCLSRQVQSPTQEFLILFFQCIFLCYCCLDIPLKMIDYMHYIHALQEKKRCGIPRPSSTAPPPAPSFGRNVLLKVCSLKVFGCLAKSLSRMQRDSFLSCSINVKIGARHLLGGR